MGKTNQCPLDLLYAYTSPGYRLFVYDGDYILASTIHMHFICPDTQPHPTPIRCQANQPHPQKGA
jgi:hypothetical protein